MRCLLPKYATVAFDSSSDLCRLYFSKVMGKSSSDTEKIRAMNDYPGATERLNMLVRRCKNLRDKGTEVVFIAHEQIEKIYAKGGAIAPKGQQPSEPVGIKGLPDMPGKQTPEEFCRAADNILRVRRVNSTPVWVANREVLQGDAYWEVKTRFWATQIRNGILPADYQELAKLASVDPKINWKPPYIWLLYGVFGIGKTRSLLSFPRPLKIFDLDRGSNVLEYDISQIKAKEGDSAISVQEYDVEDADAYTSFMGDLEACF